MTRPIVFGFIALMLTFTPYLTWAENVSTPSRIEIAKKRWASLSPKQKKSVLKKWERFKTFSNQKRRILLQRWFKFKHLSDDRKKKLYTQYKQWKSKDELEKSELNSQFKAWKRLPPHKQQLLRKQLRELGGPEPNQPIKKRKFNRLKSKRG